jgi:hypothetical protein
MNFLHTDIYETNKSKYWKREKHTDSFFMMDIFEFTGYV